MESAERTIARQKLVLSGEKIAVAVSGGVDSMCLLYYLFCNRQKLGIELVAVNVDHMIRENSAEDSKFVTEYCKKLGVPCYCFKVNVPALALQQKTGLEETARLARYKIFDNVIEKKLADKIAIAHHQSDQVETVLLNIFRGAGLKGASGMSAKQGHYIRPFLNTKKSEILDFAKQNNIQFVEDQTNQNTEYSRNFLRQQILPELRTKWKNVDSNILNFAKICRQDDEYINSVINFDDIAIYDKCARIPLYKFVCADAVKNRILRYALNKIGLCKDIERRHIEILKDLIANGQSGAKICLPNKLRACLEYDELVLSVPSKKLEFVPKDFKVGKTDFETVRIVIKKTKKFDVLAPNAHVVDAKKIPADAKWRKRQNGDVFAKFGSGEKKLKEYLIDKKIPNSVREQIPVLASGNKILCVLGHEISEEVKVTADTKYAYVITYEPIKIDK